MKRFFLRSIAPGLVNGISFRTWLELLWGNRCSVSPAYVPRAGLITCVSLLNSCGRLFEQLRFGRAIDRAPVHPPLFVLGVWRSGTTHLHNLLCRDERFAFPNTFQGINPHIFLTSERWLAPIEQLFLPATRPFDNVGIGIDEPYEDEFAIAAMSGLSPLFSWVFPKRHMHYEQHIDFSDVSKADVARWKETVLHFVKKLSLKYDRPLLLKSPNHTARIRLLLELFPDARFVYIHRHPHEVYLSNLHLIRRIGPYLTLQRFNVEQLCRRTIPWYRRLTESYLDQRTLIPEGRLVEVGFDELEQLPVPTLQYIYEQLNLPSFDHAEPAVREYLASRSGYRRNTYPEIDPETKSLLQREWQRSFEEWGYAA